MMKRMLLVCAALTAVLAVAVAAQAQTCPAIGHGHLPLKYSGPATQAAITPCDLMTRLYKYSDDSMMGRLLGTDGDIKATAYIEHEVRRLGLIPAGENGGYFQTFGMSSRRTDPAATITVDGKEFRIGVDFIAFPRPGFPQYSNAQVIYGGVSRDTMNLLDSAAVAGKIMLIAANPVPTTPEIAAALRKSAAYQAYLRLQTIALATFTILDRPFSQAEIQSMDRPEYLLTVDATREPTRQTHGISMTLSRGAGEALLGGPIATAAKGMLGKTFSSNVRQVLVSVAPGRNVVAVLPGSDPKLSGQYVAIGAHNDHIGYGQGTQGESDSLKAWGAIAHPAGAEGGRNLVTNPLTADEWSSVNAEIAAMRKFYPPRPDSIFNGADDDGTGTVSVLELAEAFAKGKMKPKRSILFVWHTGEESGMWGSSLFMTHPTVPRDSIVAQLNIDMVGRGAATDVTGQGKTQQPGTPGPELHGGDRYVQLVGSRRLSTELGDLVEKVNGAKNHGFTLDYSIDAEGHQQNIYCRSDHWSYAKWGIPVVFFTTGGHSDYHQVTDEPQYIRYQHMAALDSLIFDVAMTTANLDHRVVVDKPVSGTLPVGGCRQ